MGDHKQQQSAALRAEKAARAQEATLVTARALASQCDAHRNLGEFKEALSTCEQAQRLFSDAGDRSQTAGRIDSIALLLRDQGDLAGAKTKFEEALTIVRRIGDKRNEARYSNNLANSLSDHGEFAEAKKTFERSLNIAMEVGDKRGAINTLGNIGLTLQRMGDFAGAGPKFEAALTLAREVGNKQSEASQQIHLAELGYTRGDLLGQRALSSPQTHFCRVLATKGTTSTLSILGETCFRRRMTWQARARNSRRR